MKVLIADPISKEGIELLKEIAEVEILEEKEKLLEKIKDADAVIVRSATKITKEVLDCAEKLRVIGRAGVGVDNIDVKEATRRGIVVVNAPDASSITVAELTIGLMLALARNIVKANNSLKSRRWEKKKLMGVELRGKTLGIIGLGRIGSQVAKKAKAFEMNVVAYDPYIPKEVAKNIGVELKSLEEVLREADFLTLHVPLTEKTRHLIGEKEIKLMKDGAYLINCARGGVVDEKALYKALKEGKLSGAALDVFEKEPPFDSPLLDLENVIVTPHLGASTVEAQRLASLIVCEEVKNVLLGKPAKNVVNMPAIPKEAIERLRDYMELAEYLGAFVSKLITGDIKEVALTFCGNLKEEKYVNILTNAVLKGLLENILTEGVNLINAPIIAKNRGISVVEAKREKVEKFESSVALSVKTGREVISLEGTVILGEPRIISIDGYTVDLYPKGNILIVRHEDKPGMIGKIATILGENGINIATMQVGRKEKGKEQLMVLTLDHEVSEEILEKLRIDGVVDVRAVIL